MLEGKDILFMGIGRSAVLWYRCALPALHLGADWVGVRGQPPGVQVLTGLVRGETKLPHYEDYKVIVVQQPHGRAWLRKINTLREQGIKVLYEVDDYLHGVGKQKHHDYGKHYTKQFLAEHEMCMRKCDGIIASTEYVARRYRKFNPNVYLCRNGIDIDRYRLTRPQRPTVNIGWAGATGHMDRLIEWINAIAPLLRKHENTCLVTIGQPGVAQAVAKMIGEERAIGIPFAPLETYPAAMCLMDIALAPAGETTWYRGKSDLRWLEASALGIPTVASGREIYTDIEDDRTGFLVSDMQDLYEVVELLIEDADERRHVGEAAREYVETHRTSDIAAAQWFEVCAAVAGEYESAHRYRAHP